MLDRKYIIPIIYNDENKSNKNTKDRRVCIFKGMAHLNKIKKTANSYKRYIIATLEYLYLQIFICEALPNMDMFGEIIENMLNDKDIEENEEIIPIILEIYLLISNFHGYFVEHLQIMNICSLYELQIISHKYPKIEEVFSKKEYILNIAINCFKKSNVYNQRIKLLSFCILIYNNKENIQGLIDEYGKYINDDLLYFICFLFDNDNIEMIIKWILFAKNEFINPEILYIRKFEYFMLITRIFLGLERNIRKEIIIMRKSHRFLNACLLEFINTKDFFDIIINSFDVKEIDFTITLFNRYFNIEKESAESDLKRLIIQTKTKKLSNIFFEKCVVVDSDFIEACIINTNNIDNLKDEHILEISMSHYFPFLTRKFYMFTKCLRRIETMSPELRDKFNIYSAAKYLFEDNIKICEKSIKKVLIYLEKFPLARETIYPFFEPVLETINMRYGDMFIKGDNICNLTAESNIISLIQPTIFSREFIETFYSVIYYLREEFSLKNYINVLIRLNFRYFIDKCIFGKNYRIDDFYILSMNEIFKILEFIPEKTYFIEEYVRNKKFYFENNIFTSIMLFKKLKHFELAERMYFLEVIEELLKKYKINDKNSYEEKNKASIDFRNSIIEKEIFLIEHFYSDKILINRLINELREGEPDNFFVIESMIAVLERNNQFNEGLIFNNSKISIEGDFTKFCIYSIFYQYNSNDKQTLFKFIDENFEYAITLQNGRIVNIINNGGDVENFLVKEDFHYNKRLSLGIKYYKKKLTLYINGAKHIVPIKYIKKIIIGNEFKGIISKILWYENEYYNKKYLENKSRSEFFTNHLIDLEKILKFKSQKGFYMDGLYPYFFTGKINIEMKNIFHNENIHWISNQKLVNIMSNELEDKNDLKKLFLDTISRYIMKKQTFVNI